MWKNGGGGEIDDDEGMIENESVGSIGRGDSLREVVD